MSTTPTLLNLKYITLTGVDEQTSLVDLKSFVEEFPEVEIGILYTKTPSGRNRYPSREWILEAVKTIPKRAALHICGARARDELVNNELSDIVNHVSRVQVNGVVAIEEMLDLSLQVPTLITQHTEANKGIELLYYSNHQVLIDSSGGRGIKPESYTVPDTYLPIGLAGGLGPNNLYEEMIKFAPLCKPNGWVDMESSLRNEDDLFDLNGRARTCAQIFRETLNSFNEGV